MKKNKVAAVVILTAPLASQCYDSYYKNGGVASLYRHTLDISDNNIKYWTINGIAMNYNEIWNSQYQGIVQYLRCPQNAIANYGVDNPNNDIATSHVGHNISINFEFNPELSHKENVDNIYSKTIEAYKTQII